MNYLAKRKDTIFLGQSVLFSGNAIFNTLDKVPKKKKIELPVFEDIQMGISTGWLKWFCPNYLLPRFVLISATNQLVII